jgi:hypothetical protein
MTCCIFGAALTAAVLGVASFVRHTLFRQPRPPDPTAWHLELPGLTPQPREDASERQVAVS